MQRKSATARTAPGWIFAGGPSPGSDAVYQMHQERARPVAANAEPRGEAALLDIIRRALDGDPFPVSGARPTVTPKDETLADKIRGILNHDENHEKRSAQIGSGSRDQSARSDIAAAFERHEEVAPTLTSAPLADVTSPEPSPRELPRIGPRDEELAPAFRPRRIFGPAALAFVACAAILGAAVPALVLDGSPRFAAEARLQARTDVPPGWLEATARRIISQHSLTQAVAKLKLDRDPEFASRNAGVWTVASELLLGNEGASDAPSRAQAALGDAISVGTDGRAGTLRLSVTTGNGQKSARIANLLADAAIYDAMIAEGTDSTRTKAARAAFDSATAALDAFTRENGAERIKVATDLQRQRKDLEAEIAAAHETTAIAREKSALTQSIGLDGLLAGSFADAPPSPALDDLRQRYVAAKTELSQLSVDLGPRHPRLIAQKATVDGLMGSMQAELRRLAATADAELAAAVADENRLSSRMAALGKQSDGIDLARLGKLQSNVETMRASYEAASASAAKPIESGAPLSVVTPAVGMAVGDSGLLPLEAAGFILGLSAAVLSVLGFAWRRGAPHGGNVVEEEAAAVSPIEPPSFVAAGEMPHAPSSTAHIALENRPIAAPWSTAQDLAVVRHDMATLREKLEAYASLRARRGKTAR